MIKKPWAVLLCFILFFAACNQQKKEEPTAKDDTELPVKVTTSDSLGIAYKLAPGGDTTLLFIHGWAINKSYWDGQLATFSPRYTVVAYDQIGFGASDTGRRNFTMEQYAADAAAVIQQLKLKNVVLIGHSMSGDVILETAVRYPENVIAMVGIDNFNIVGYEFSAKEMQEIDDYEKKMREDFSNIIAAYSAQSLFHKTTDTLIRARILSDFNSSNRTATLKTFRTIIDYSPKEAERLPLLKYRLNLLNSDVNKTDTAGLKKLTGSSFRVYPIHATGHYPMIEKPGEFNRILQQIIDEAGR